jgi:hypothetical protein
MRSFTAILSVLSSMVFGPWVNTPAIAPSPATRTQVVYRADTAHGWSGWSASGWSVQNGILVSDGTVGEIAVPYVPSEHRLRSYAVVVQTTAYDAPPDPNIIEFSIIARKFGDNGYRLDFTNCEYVPCMSIVAMADRDIDLKDKYVDGSDGRSPHESTLTFSLNGSHLQGTRYDYAPEWEGGGATIHVRASDTRYRRAGSIALQVAGGVQVHISSVTVERIARSH